MALGIGSLFSPKAAMNIVKAAIEKTIKQDVNDFDLIYKHHEKIIDFRLYNYKDEHGVLHDKIVLKYSDGEKLCGIIHSMLKEKSLVSDKIQFAVASYKSMSCKLLVLRGDEKKTLTFQL